MKASISFPELQNILKEKTDLTILEIVGSDLLVKLDAGMGTDTLMNTALSLLHNKLPEGLIEKRPDRQLMLHLGSIEQVKTVFDAIQVDDIHVLTEGLEVEGGLK